MISYCLLWLCHYALFKLLIEISMTSNCQMVFHLFCQNDPLLYDFYFSQLLHIHIFNINSFILNFTDVHFKFCSFLKISSLLIAYKIPRNAFFEVLSSLKNQNKQKKSKLKRNLVTNKT